MLIKFRFIILILIAPIAGFSQRLGLIKTADFADGKLSGIPFSAQLNESYAAVIKSDTVRFPGSKSLRLEMRYQDYSLLKRRAEYADSLIKQGERWYGLSIFTPKTYVADTVPEILTQFHAKDQSDPFNSPNVALQVKNGRYSIRVAWSTDGITKSTFFHMMAGL
ncbi:hypothetical protein DJ568_10285 [Mucilaginibacter hurinus]|uniref:Uncharacterized protein n=1 Tax=Mucilaginibacter hurinus TaxID=2201324 RepID=A0A367GN13_9SPHI|nr:heparin lyase I family protein [Mucilaginibacter hurinus]RCH54859.1 hypothetical protein DJ568_10285 [Mucilaginibacter hurinus]